MADPAPCPPEYSSAYPPAYSSAPVPLFCFPFAGGNGSTFRAWPQSAGVTLCPVELPGRQQRFGEPPHRRMDDLVAMLIAELGARLVPPFALFGHSMGALIAYALAIALRRSGRAQPCHLLLSGRGAPHVADPTPRLHALSDAALLRRLSPGTGDRAEHALLEVMLPTLRADVELCETYAPPREPPLAMPITVFAGTEDAAVSAAALKAWRGYTRAGFAVRRFPGGHQYLGNQAPALAAAIAEALAPAGPAADSPYASKPREPLRWP